MTFIPILCCLFIIPLNGLYINSPYDVQVWKHLPTLNKINHFYSPNFGKNAPPFVYNFLAQVINSDKLYHIMFSALQESKSYYNFYNLVYKSSIEYNAPDPNAIAKSISDAIHSVIDTLTPLEFAQAVSNTIAHLLNDHGLLSVNNALELSRQLAQDFIDIELTIGKNLASDDYLRVIADGGLKFLVSLNIGSVVTSQDYATYICKEFYSLRKP